MATSHRNRCLELEGHIIQLLLDAVSVKAAHEV